MPFEVETTDGQQPLKTAVPGSDKARPATKPSKDEPLKTRTLERQERSEARRARAEEHKETGNAHFHSGEYQKAIEEYKLAVKVHGPRAAYWSNLAAAWLKLEEWDNAEDCVQRALEVDPTFMKARYRGGMARKGNLQLIAAFIDFRVILTQDPTSMEAEAALCETADLMRARGEEDGQFDAPQLTHDAAPDCRHVGNGKPCRAYNHGGCAQGTQCKFSHAPDHKSVRDELGRNVCMFSIFGTCAFGANRCFYAHERTYLRRGGWWDDPEKRALYADYIGIAKRVEMPVKGNATLILCTFENSCYWNWPEMAALDEQLRGCPRDWAPSSPAQLRTHSLGSSAGARWGTRGNRGKGRGGGGKRGRRAHDSPWDEDPFSSRSRNHGFTPDEVEELMCQGVKPWDDDAYDVLEALRSM
ncbi:hypothetical protein BC834DRAFT_1042072 [Gloeopeniophorella convolvens]|nr:hypothetical protein BC834DRAFT_1042072 [Gloeopeniophorella convolvens]